MQKKIFSIGICVLLLVMATGCKPEDQIQQSVQQGSTGTEIVIRQEPTSPQNVLKVSGSGEVTVSPNIAEVSLAVVTQEKTAEDAEKTNNETMTAVLETLYGFQIAESDIKSGYFNLNPIYDYSKEKESIVGYRVNNELQVTIRNIDELGDILSAAMAAGANDVGSISFRLEDSGEAYRNALKAAVEDAGMKAKAMAESAGLSISGTPYSIEETSCSATPVNYDSVTVMEEANDENSDISVPISCGELTVSAQIKAEYLIEE